ncbi:MAG TPA: 2-C-methyl-D-erythritol 2,4-cyclodiphosphate synthase, partial [Candidatus Acidoferrales bacterium]|nr:2-C-methyl-D-erythritol 2,4-cyclodiphosphate synthase [Candidatus Acidoferrales bacterium]
MNLGDFEPLHHLSLKAAMCFQAAMLAAISEKADAIRAVHVLSGIKDKSPETLEGFDLASAGIELKSTRIEWPETEGPVCGTVGYEAPLSDDLKKVLEAAKLTARKYRSGRIAPIHLLCGLAKSDSDLESKLAIAGATAERLDERCRYESRADEWRIPLTQTGIAYDLHRLVEGRKLILGGVELAFEKGPAGHSDGDVLSHAICDALLGAGGLGD